MSRRSWQHSAVAFPGHRCRSGGTVGLSLTRKTRRQQTVRLCHGRREKGSAGAEGGSSLVCSGMGRGLGGGKRGSVMMLYGDVTSYKGDEGRSGEEFGRAYERQGRRKWSMLMAEGRFRRTLDCVTKTQSPCVIGTF